MADNLITTNITATANFSSLRTQLAATTASLIKLQETTAGTNAKLANQIAVMNKAFATTLTSTGQFSQHFVSLTSDVEKFGRNLDRGRLKLGEYYNAWSGHTKKTSNLIKDLAKQQVMLQNAIVQPIGKNAQGLMQYNVMVAKGLDEVKNKMAIATQQAAIMNKVMKDGATQLINWGKNTQWAGRQLTVGLTVPLAAFGLAAQKAFRDADAELVRLTKVYGGLSAVSAVELAKVRKDVSDTAREIAGSYGIAYKDTIALAADLAATGQQGAELLASTKETSRLAILGEVDRQDAMKATLAIQNAFKQSTQELSESINFLNAVENQTSTSLQDLVEAIPKAGPVVKSLGGDVQDLALYLTAMKEGGVNASEGANAIKSAMASLINPTKVAKEMFFGFGIDIDKIVTSNAGNLTATIVELQGALDSLNPLSKSRAIEQLFGKFQYARMSALFENMGKEGSQTLQVMDLMKASAADLAGIADRELGMMTESASGKFKRALASVQADLAVVGNQFLTISTKILQVVDGIIKFFQKLPAPVKSFLTALGGLTAVAGPIIMLAGVMGNFIGYVVKGIFHLRELVKGGQGFRLLTPEIIAADAAAKGLASTFYSDTEATVVLTNAVNALTNSFALLETKAASAAVKVQPGISTVAGTVLAAGGYVPRIVDKENPLVGKPYSRDMSHLTPAGTSQMGTIFGTVPGAGPVNVRIGKNPQAYMDSDLPRIPGVTSVNGISTGIVSQEAAKWHAMTAAIAMQSEAEIKTLKAEVMATGTITSSLSDSYQALLPQFTEITSMAAQETAAIVQQLQASKITVEQARARVLQLNANVEAMLAETTALTAAGMGRTANLTMVPLTGQPVVDPVTGKSNMKEMFHKGNTKDIVDRIARALGGVRTSGAGYNIQTTKPAYQPNLPGLNKGGIVPGTGNTDTHYTTAEPGAFVINKASTERHMPTISKLLGGTPTFRNTGGMVPVVLTPGEAVIPAKIATKNPDLMMQLNGGPGNTGGMGRHSGGGIDSHKHPHVAPSQISQKKQELLSIHDVLSDKDYYEKNRTRYILNSAWAIKQGGSKSSNPITDAQAVQYAEEMFEEHVKLSGGSQKRFEFLAEGPIQESIEKRLRKDHPRFKLLLPKGLSDAVINAKTKKAKTAAVDKIRGKSPILPPEQRAAIWNLMKGRAGINQAALFEIDPVSPNSVDRSHGKPIASLARHSVGYAGQAVVLPSNINKIMYRYEQFGLSKNWLPTFGQDASREAKNFLRRIGLGGGVTVDEVKKAAKISKSPQQFQAVLYAATMGGGGPAWLRAFNRGRVSFTGLNKGGTVPGQFAQKLFGGGRLFLGMPKTLKQVEAQRAAKLAMEKADQAVKNSKYRNDPVTIYDERLEVDKKGHSFPVAGIGGVYSKNGEKFFVKPVVDSKGALGESRGTTIHREAHDIETPNQKVVVIKDPTDPTGRRKVLALESKYDPAFANLDETFDENQYFKQLVASALRGDKDLGRGNIGGNRLPDVGTSGVFSTASPDPKTGVRNYSATMPSFKHQATVNLLGVKGSGAKRFFAEATADIPKGMTADQYHQRMLDEIELVLPKLKQTIGRFDLDMEEKVVYEAMIQRLSDARRENYRDLHGIHSSITIAPEKTVTPAAIAKMMAADELKRRQKGHSVSLSDNLFKTDANGFMIGGMIGNVTKGKAMHRIGAGFGPTGEPATSSYGSAPWGVNSLTIGMGEKLFGKSGLTKRAQNFLYDKFAAQLAKEMPYGYTKNAAGNLIKAIEPSSMDSVVRAAAADLLSAAEARKTLSAIDREILRKKYTNWESKKDTPLTESLRQLIFNLEGRQMGGPVSANTPYIVGEAGPEIFVPRNTGGIIPNTGIAIPPQGYMLGGGILAQTALPAGMAIGTSLIAQKVANPIAQMIIQQIGFILPMMMMNSMMMNKMQGGGKTGGIMSKIPASMKSPMGVFSEKTGGLTKYGAGLDKMATSGKPLPTMLSKIGFAATRLNLGIALLATAVMVGKDRFDAYKESMRLNALGFGMTAEGAEKAGLKFTDYNKKIKDAISDAKALRETNRLLFESRANSGTSLNITVEEFKKLKKESKELFKDQIALINKTSADDQEALAIRLKQQFIAMGMSAEEATKKIYAIYAVSNFSSSAAEYTVASDGFNSIKTSIDAAVGALRTYNDAIKNKLDPTEQANAFNTALMATKTAVQDAEDKAMKEREKEGVKGKKLKFISQSEREDISFAAEKDTLEKITRTVGSQEQLGQELTEELKKQNPELDKLITKYDTSLSVFQKLRLVAKGFTGDLSKLNASQTNAVYQLQSVITSAVANENRSGMLKKQYTEVDNLRKLQDKYEKAAKGQKVSQQIADRDKLSALQKQIDANNKLADARIKALTAAKEENDLGREIAKKKAEYDAAIATGDDSGAQIIAMDIQGLESQVQYNSQVKAIEQARDQKNSPLLKQIEAIQKKQKDLGDAAALAGEKLGDVSKAIDKQESAIDKVNSTMAEYRLQLQIHKDDLTKFKDSDVANELLTSIAAAAEAAKIDFKELGIKKNAAGKYDAASGQQLFDQIAGSLETSLLKDGIIVNGDLIVNGKKIDIGSAAASKAKEADPTKVAGRTEGSGAYNDPKKYFDNAGNPVSEKSYKEMPVGAPNDGKEYVVPVLGMNNREFIDRGAASREFFKSTDGKGQLESMDGFKFMANGIVMKNNKVVGSWLAALPGSSRVKSYNEGSMGGVKGPGTATSDSIPAMLSNGEYVVRASAVSQYGVPFFDNLNAQKFAGGGMVDPNPNTAPIKKPEMLNLNGEFYRVNNSSINKIIEEMRAIFAKEPKVEKFTDRADYYKAYKAWADSSSFAIPPSKSYPEKGQEYPMGSLKRFLAVAESQSGSGVDMEFKGYGFADHGYKFFNPETAFAVKEALNSKLAKPKDVLSYLDSMSSTNKFSIDSNKKYKLGNDVLAWCGAYIAWVAEKSGVNISKNMFSSHKATKEYKDSGEFKDPSNKSFAPGDIVWWDWANRHPKNSPDYKSLTPGTADHVDIITKKFKGLEFELIGGGLGSKVGKRTIDFGDEKESKALFGSVSPIFKKPEQTSDTSTPTVDGYADGGLVPGVGGLAKRVSQPNGSKSFLKKAYDNFLFPTVLSADRLLSGFSGGIPFASTNIKKQKALHNKAKKYGMMSVAPEMLGTALLDASLLAFGSGPVVTGAGRSLLGAYGASKGIPGLGTLLPKGSIPYLTASGSKFATNAGTAAMIGAAKPFAENRIAPTIQKPKIKVSAEQFKPNQVYPPYVLHEGMNVPLHSGGPFGNDAVVFQGTNENLSSLLTNHQVSAVIPTTPEGILSYILKKDPANKKAQSILDKINSGYQWGDKNVKEFLMNMLASGNINLKNINPNDITNNSSSEGLIQLISAMRGNTKDAIAIKSKTKAMSPMLARAAKEYAEIAKEQAVRIAEATERAGGVRGGLHGFRGEAPLTRAEIAAYRARGMDPYAPPTPNDIPMIRVFNDEFPTADASGDLFETSAGFKIFDRYVGPKGSVAGTDDAASHAVARTSRHFGIYDAVQSHYQGSWKPDKPFIVSTLSNLMKYNGKPEQLHSNDSFFLQKFGQPFKFSKKEGHLSSVFPLEEAAYIKKLTELGLYKGGSDTPIMAESPSTKEIFYLAKEKYSQSELDQILKEINENSNLRPAAQVDDAMRSKPDHERRFGDQDLYMPARSSYEVDTPMSAQRALQIIAIDKAKKQIGINQPYSYAVGGEHVSLNENVIQEIASKLGVRFDGGHNSGDLDELASSSGSNPFTYLLNEYKTSVGTPNTGTTTTTKALDALLMWTRFGKYESGKTRPNPNDLKQMQEFIINQYSRGFISGTEMDAKLAQIAGLQSDMRRLATGGSVKDGKIKIPGFAAGGYANPAYYANMSVPQFENGINNVPADMLAVLHKNEAVLPERFNPFNPNANNATMGGTYHITNNINGFDGDINQLSRMVTQQTVTAIQSMDSRGKSMVGPQMNVSIT